MTLSMNQAMNIARRACRGSKMLDVSKTFRNHNASRSFARLFAMCMLFAATLAQAQVSVTTTALPMGVVGSKHYFALGATGGTAPYTFTLGAGNPPVGLTMSTAGLITGTPTTLTAGAPPIADAFTVNVSDSAGGSTSQTYRLPVLAPGSHTLVLNQIYTGAKGSASAPYIVDYVEAFNAGPVSVDLQNWTVQYTPATSDFVTSGNFPIGSLDAYHVGTTGGSDGLGSYPAFNITYSSGFTATNCNAAAPASPLNAAFPASHCWLNPGQFLLIQIVASGSTTPTSVQAFPLTPDLDLSGGVASNVGAVSGATKWINHSGTTVAPNPSSGKFALVNSVNPAFTCPTTNPTPQGVFAPLASDFVAYFAAGGSATVPTCWEGADRAYYASSSAKNTSALVRAAGNGVAAGTALKTTASLTPCGDTDNNLTDFAPATIGSSGQTNWVLHNGNQQVTRSTTTAPTSYTQVGCSSLIATGPAVTAVVDQPTAALNQGGGSITETLTVTVTPSSAPVATRFNVAADLTAITGASSATPLTPSSIGTPDASGNFVYTETISFPTSAIGTFNIPVTVMDDAFRWATNASGTAPLNVSVHISAACQVPVAADQSIPLSWNTSQPLALAGSVGANCDTKDTLAYAIQAQPAHGSLSGLSGNAITYTPQPAYSGYDSFTYQVTDTTAAPPLVSKTATVTLVVSATGVTPTLSISCPTVTYDSAVHSCNATTTPFVTGTTTLTYAGSSTPPSAAGTYSVAASFTAASPAQNATATGSLVITQATPAINLVCTTVPFDGSTHGCTVNVSGVTPGAVAGTTVITYGGSSTLPGDGGTYPVVATFTSSDPNYTNQVANGTLTINVPTITITAVPASVTYGGTLPTLTYSVSPSVYLSVAPICLSSATGSSPVGTYAGAITCSGAIKSGNKFVYIPATMTVTQSAAVVAATQKTMSMGSAVPALTYTTSPAGVTFTTAPTCTTTATTSSPLDTYPITCIGGVSQNYTLTYTASTLTVTPAVVVPNVTPTLTTLTPMYTQAGATATLLTVTGSNFVTGATILWNGATRVTTFVNATTLTTTLPASDLTTIGLASVSVLNPAPGGGLASPMTFSVNTATGSAGSFYVNPQTPALSIAHGKTGVMQLVISGVNPGVKTTALCYNLPATASCVYSTATATITVTTDATTPLGNYNVLIVCSTATLTASVDVARGYALYAFIALPFGLLPLCGKKRRRPVVMLAALMGLTLLFAAGCGGTSTTATPTVIPAQTSTSITLTVS